MRNKFSHVQMLDRRKIKKLKRKKLVHKVTLSVALGRSYNDRFYSVILEGLNRDLIYNKIVLSLPKNRRRVFHGDDIPILTSTDNLDMVKTFMCDGDFYVIFDTVNDKAKFIMRY